MFEGESKCRVGEQYGVLALLRRLRSGVEYNIHLILTFAVYSLCYVGLALLSHAKSFPEAGLIPG